jgi:phage terminase large subunit
LAPAEAILRWRSEGPTQWAIECLGVDPEDWQITAGKLLATQRKLSVRSGHGVGKSAFFAWCVLWFQSSFYPCKIPATAPTAHQLADVLWPEIAKWHRVLTDRIPELGKEFEWQHEKFILKSNPAESFAVSRTSRPEKPEALQGFHSDHILFLIDEASGVHEEIFRVGEGALSSENAYVAMAANPTRMEGYFYESHHKQRSRWATLHVNGEDCKRVSKQYIEDMAAKYGRDSDVYKVRVQGEFATAEDGVIPLGLIEAATLRDIKAFGPEVWGLDVARFGTDRTALAKRQGAVMAQPVKHWSGKDTMQTVGLVKNEYDACLVKPSVIFVDVIGLGAGVVDRGREIGLPVVGVNVAESPAVKDQFMRQRDELWWAAREWFAGRDVQIVEDDALIAELTLPTYKILSTGKIQVESKDDIKKRGVTSPDLADAFCLTFANGGVSTFKRKQTVQKKDLAWVV